MLLAKALQVEQRAKALCSSKTVADSITHEFTPNGVRVYSPLPLAYWIEKGTGIYGPHRSPIVPVRGKYLVFPSNNSRGFTFATSVDGTPAKPFLEPALRSIT